MSASSNRTPDTAVKGSNLRGIIAVLQREGSLERVLAVIPADVRGLYLDPPASTAWISFEDMDHLQRAIETTLGVSECRRISREAVISGLVPLLQSVIGGLLRLFGSSPHTILSRLADIMKITTRGVEYQYTRVGERACRLRVAYPLQRGMRAGAFESIAGGLEAVFNICKVDGVVSQAAVIPDGRSNAADFDIRW